MRVSIVITSYNYGPWLARAIDSALAQSYPDVEVIVVDDGSTDNSREIISRYGDRVTTILQDNAGQCAATNAGFARSNGEIVIFLDADDALYGNSVELHVAEFERGPIVKSCGYMEIIDADGRPIGVRMPRQLPQSGDYREVTLQQGLDALRMGFTSSQAWSRSFLEQVMPLPEDETLGPDGYLMAIDRLFGPLAFIDAPVVRYRRHDQNKGPVRYRLDTAYLRKRVGLKQSRLAYAEQWIARLGLSYDPQAFRRNRDWRLTLMAYLLNLLDKSEPTVSLHELVTTPFRGPQRSRSKSALLASSLLLIWMLPEQPSLVLANTLLERTQPTGVLAD